MGFSNEWELSYANNTHLSIWPWSDLVSLFNRFTKNRDKSELKVLELGVGAGANIPFFLKNKIEYYGIEGSETMMNHLKDDYKILSDRLLIGDFTKDWNIDNDIMFDFIIDRASVTHNKTSDIQKIISQSYDRLKPGGGFIGIDWFSTNHYCYKNGINIEDEFTKISQDDGYFAGLGNVHFSNHNHMTHLFKKFNIQYLSEKLLNIYEPKSKSNEIIGTWNIVAIKNPENV